MKPIVSYRQRGCSVQLCGNAVSRQPPKLNAGNGVAMKSQTLRMKLAELNILRSQSRQRVSN